MSITDAVMPLHRPLIHSPPQQSQSLGHSLSSSHLLLLPRLPHLDNLAAAASTATAPSSSPSNDMSPAQLPTESSRHSTPATSADGSDHTQPAAHINDPSSSSSSKAPIDTVPQKPTSHRSPRPSTPPQQLTRRPQSQHEEHPPRLGATFLLLSLRWLSCLFPRRYSRL